MKWCERCELREDQCHCLTAPTAAEIFAAYLTVEARQARRKMIRWVCKECPLSGYDGPGIPTFWSHWARFHAGEPMSLRPTTINDTIYRGVR